MKLTVNISGEIVKTIIMELTPEEAIIVNHAMRRYTEDEGVNQRNREEMDKMLFVEPRFIELEPSKDGVKSELENVLDKIRAEIVDLDGADCDYEGYYNAVTDAVKIIDKYKVESEDKE